MLNIWGISIEFQEMFNLIFRSCLDRVPVGGGVDLVCFYIVFQDCNLKYRIDFKSLWFLAFETKRASSSSIRLMNFQVPITNYRYYRNIPVSQAEFRFCFCFRKSVFFTIVSTLLGLGCMFYNANWRYKKPREGRQQNFTKIVRSPGIRRFSMQMRTVPPRQRFLITFTSSWPVLLEWLISTWK